VGDFHPAPPVATFSASFLAGFEVLYATANTVIVGPGSCRNSGNTFDITLAGSVTPSLAVSGVNGLDTGVEAASTWYAVFVIADPTGANPTASLFSTSSTLPVLPSGYGGFRRVGWVRNDASSNIVQFQTTGKGTLRRTKYLNAESTRQILTGGSAVVSTSVSASSHIPSTSRMGIFHGRENGTSSLIFMQSTAGSNLITILGLGGNEIITELPTTSTQGIAYNHSGAGTEDADIWVLGYEESI